jgi:predicted transposase YbfD/YdcC
MSVMMITFVSILGGCNGWEEIEDFGTDREAWFRTFLDLPNGIPSADTDRRLLAALRPSAVAECIRAWTASVTTDLCGQVLAFDGKTLRGAATRFRGELPAALHKVHLWASEQRLVLGQAVVEGAPNEPDALLAMLQILNVKGAIITGDANQTTKAVAAAILDAGAGYTLVVKRNRRALYDSIAATFTELWVKDDGATRIRHARIRSKGHGRTEVREGWSIPASAVPDLAARVPGVQSVTRIERTRFVGATLDLQREECFVVSSQKPTVRKILDQVREHWSVENRLHWTLDVQMGEDACAIHDANAAQNVSILRTLALALLHRDATFKAGVSRKQAKVSRNNKYAEHVLGLISPEDLVR